MSPYNMEDETLAYMEKCIKQYQICYQYDPANTITSLTNVMTHYHNLRHGSIDNKSLFRNELSKSL